MFLTIDHPNGSTRTINLDHVGEWYYKPVDPVNPSCLTMEGPGGRERLSFRGHEADALHATLAEMLASGKVASFRCKLPAIGGAV